MNETLYLPPLRVLRGWIQNIRSVNNFRIVVKDPLKKKVSARVYYSSSDNPSTSVQAHHHSPHSNAVYFYEQHFHLTFPGAHKPGVATNFSCFFISNILLWRTCAWHIWSTISLTSFQMPMLPITSLLSFLQILKNDY